MNILETERLYLREFKTGDAEDLFHLNEDADVLQFTGDEPFPNIEEAKQFVLDYKHYATYGFGRWAVIRKQDDGFLGWCGLKYTPALEEHDIGFRFFKKYWGQGFASESAKACIEYGFRDLKIAAFVGRAMKANPASVRVLEKIGLTYLDDFDFEGEQGVKYRISRRVQ